MSEQLQIENEGTSIESEEIQVHEETGQEQVQQEEPVLAQGKTTPSGVANEDLEEKSIIQEEQKIVPEQGDGKHQQEDTSQQDVILNEEKTQELQQELNDSKEERPLAIEDIVKSGKFGVTNSQIIPAMKQVIADGSVEKLRMLRSMYLYSFEDWLKYLKINSEYVKVTSRNENY